MTTSINEILLKRGELKYLTDTLKNSDVSSVRDVILERSTARQKSILCGDLDFSVRDVIVDHYVHNVFLPNETLNSVKKILKERGIV